MFSICTGKIEVILRLSPYIDNVCIVANPDFYFVVALIVPNPNYLLILAQSLSIDTLDFDNLCHNEKLVDAFLQLLKQHATRSKLMYLCMFACILPAILQSSEKWILWQ